MKRRLEGFFAVILVFSAIIGFGCSSTTTTEGVSAEVAAPSLIITSPTGQSGYTTTSATVDISGTSTDNTSVSTVTWANDAGSDTSGTATYTSSTGAFTATGIALTAGDNNITFTATDSGGNTSTDTLLVVYNPYLNFTSSPSLVNLNADSNPAQDYVYVNTPTELTVSVSVAAGSVVTSMKLVKVTSSTTTEDLATMADTGDVDTYGDDIAGDNVWSGQYTFNEATGVVTMRIQAVTAGGTSNTETFTLAVLTPLTTASITTITTLTSSAQEQYDAYIADGQSVTEAKAALVTWLGEQDGVATAGSSDNGVWWVYSTGVLGGLIIETDAEGSDIRGGGFAKSSNILKNKKISVTKAAGDDTITTGSNKAILLGAFHTQFEGWGGDENDEINTILTDAQCPTYDVNGPHYDADATVEKFKTLDDYGVIVITSHGDNWYNGLFNWWSDEFGKHLNALEGWMSQVIVLTRTQLTDANKATYDADLQQQRLVVVGANNYLAITPAFIAYYCDGMPDSIVYLGSCRSTYNRTMTDAFLAAGAKTVYGYSDYVKSSFAYDHGQDIFEDLVQDGDESGEVRGLGDDDGDTTPATLGIRGAENLTMALTGIVNGDFEEGSTDGWSGEGDARAISGLGTLTPQSSSSYMGIISSGLGSVDGDSSYMQQTFCVPAGITTLSFTYDFVSEEPECYPEFDDSLLVSLLEADGSSIATLATQSVGTSSWTYLGGDYFAGGDDASQGNCDGANVHDGTWETVWKTESRDVSAYAGTGTPIILKFYVEDEGDGVWDSAAVIDDVELQ